MVAVIKYNEVSGRIHDALPVKAVWDKGRQSDWFVSRDAAQNYLIGRLWRSPIK